MEVDYELALIGILSVEYKERPKNIAGWSYGEKLIAMAALQMKSDAEQAAVNDSATGSSNKKPPVATQNDLKMLAGK